MKLAIGENIRRLRRERDFTQEELADMLGVAYQSVSRWETGACYPDMELLPAIAAFFECSVDELMGLNASREEAAVQAVLDDFQQAISKGDVSRCIDIARAGLKQHPGSYALMNKLMYALFVAGDNTGNIPDWQENMMKYDAEITRLGERIMKFCPDQDIRLEATARLAFNHCEMGRTAQGRAIYETLPGIEYAREMQIWEALDETEKLENARDLVRKGYYALVCGVWRLMDREGLTDAEQEAVARKRFELEALINDGDGEPSNGQWGVRFARVLARQGKQQEALEQLSMAMKRAVAFDNRPDSGVIQSVLLGRRVWKRSDYETADTRPAAKVLRESWLSHRDFDALRQTEAFQKLLSET